MNRIVLIIILGLGCFSANAQTVYNSSGKKGAADYKQNEEVKGFDKNKIILGGGLTLGFGGSSYYGNVFSAGIFPIAGYRFNDYFSAGISVGYLYQSYGKVQHVQNYNTGMVESYPLRFNHIRGGVWARVTPLAFVNGLNNIFAHVELEQNRSSYKLYSWEPQQNAVTKETISQSALSLLVGPGYKQQISPRVSMVYMVLWDVFQNASFNMETDPNGQKYSKSPYWRTQDIRLGINIGF